MTAAGAVLAALTLAAAAPTTPIEPAASPEVEQCLAGAERVKEVGRLLDDSRVALELEDARKQATAALGLARMLEAEHGLRLPFLGRFLKEQEKDANRRDLAERMHFTAERLRSTCKLLGKEVPAPASTDRALAVAILSRPEYELRSRDEQFLARLFQRIWTWMRDVFAESELVQKAAISTRAVFLVVTCLAVAYLAWRLSKIRLKRRTTAAAMGLGAVVLDDPARYEKDAGGALDRGDGREAIRNGLLSLLATLERVRLATPGRSATNREVAEHVEARGGSPALAGSVHALMSFYDRAWYSLSAVPLDEARRFVGEARSARDEAARFRPKEAA
ncbi:MAG: DUF4129 domain-containing protein [Myxococcales bacterium]